MNWLATVAGGRRHGREIAPDKADSERADNVFSRSTYPGVFAIVFGYEPILSLS